MTSAIDAATASCYLLSNPSHPNSPVAIVAVATADTRPLAA
jgi:hypothetical protein